MTAIFEVLSREDRAHLIAPRYDTLRLVMKTFPIPLSFSLTFLP